MTEKAIDEILDELADSFAARFRAGENPSIEEYTQRYPELSLRIRNLLSTVLEFESGLRDAELGGLGSVADGEFSPTELGDFLILREIGRGGMGVVYDAEQKTLDRRVALKVLPGCMQLDHRQLERFRREARAAARLQHPNIVPVFGFGEDQGVHYFAMQLIQGQGLDDVLTELCKLRADGSDGSNREGSQRLVSDMISGAIGNQDGKVSAESVAPTGQSDSDSQLATGFSSSSTSGGIGSAGSTSSGRSGTHPYYRSVVRIGVQAAEALHYAHGRRLLHRDVKPSNLILDNCGKVWVTDFGLAKDELAGKLTNTGDLVGTLRYMAPERFRGWCDPRSDVYSLGLTLYELLVLRPAFPQSDRAQLMKDITHEEPKRLRRVDPGVPRDLETIVLKAIAKEPAQRYATAGDLAADLQRFTEGKPIHARRTPVGEQVALWCLRNPVVAGLSMFVVALLLLAVLISSWAAIRFERIAVEKAEALRVQGFALERATDAERLASERLFDSLLAQVRAERVSGRAGRRLRSVDAIEQAAKLAEELNLGDDRTDQLRDEAIASLVLVDLKVAQQWPGHPPVSEQVRVAFDRQCERYARLEPNPSIDDKRRRYGDVVVRKIDDNRELQRVPGLGYMVRRPYLCFDPTGDRLAVYGISKDDLTLQLQVWDLRSRQCLIDEAAGGEWYASNVAFSPDGHWLAMVDHQQHLALLDLDVGQFSERFTSQELADIRALQFSPDGTQLAVAHGNRLQILDWQSDHWSQHWDFVDTVKDVAWHPNGSALAVASGFEISVVLLETKRVRCMSGTHSSFTQHVFFNHRGNWLASTSGDGTTRIWDAVSGLPIVESGQCGVAFSQDDRWLAWGTAGASVGRWQVLLGVGSQVVDCQPVFSRQARLSVHHRWLAVTTTSGVQWADLLSGKTVGGITIPGILSGRIGSSGRTYWTSTPSSNLRFSLHTSPESLHIKGPDTFATQPGWHTIALSHDERWFLNVIVEARRSSEGAWIERVDNPGQAFFLPHENCRTADFSPDGKWVATGCRRGRVVKIWEVESGRHVRDLDVPGSVVMCFSADGKWLSTANERESVLWRTGSWTPSLRIPRSVPGEIGAVAFDPHCRFLAVLDQLSTVRLIAAESGHTLARIQALDSRPIHSLTMSNNGRFLVAAPRNGRPQCWDLASLNRRLAQLGLDWPQQSGHWEELPEVTNVVVDTALESFEVGPTSSKR